MTAPESVATPAAAAKSTPLWEDFIDIFYAPSAVFERRRNANPWPMILIITALVTIIGVLTWNAISPVVEAEVRALAAKQVAANPQAAAGVETGVKFQLLSRRWGGVFFPIGVLFISLFVWGLGPIAGAKELTYTRALVVSTWTSILAVVMALLLGLQGLVMDVSALTTMDKLSFSAARFVDKGTMSAFAYAALKMVDVFGIWSVIVMSIGVKVTGRASKGGAIAFGVAWFVLSLLITGVIAARTG